MAFNYEPFALLLINKKRVGNNMLFSNSTVQVGVSIQVNQEAFVPRQCFSNNSIVLFFYS
jgi:hypothetical protein